MRLTTGNIDYIIFFDLCQKKSVLVTGLCPHKKNHRLGRWGFVRRGVRTSIIVDAVDVFDFVWLVAVLQIEVHVYQGPEG